MPLNVKLYPYNMGSESGRDLAELLNVSCVRPDGNYVPRVGHSVINWGSGRSPEWLDRASSRGVAFLNKISAVSVASNKLRALQALTGAGVRIPEFTTSMSVAQTWLTSGGTVMERHELRGNSGAGIRIVNLDDDKVESYLTSAPLYTKFIPKTKEFRVHVVKGQVIDLCEKKRKSQDRRPENFNRYICSTEVGWVFVRNGISDIPEVRQIALDAVRALGLDFGAVDVVFFDGKPYVLEVNTAPGLAGTTLVKYANAFRRLIGMPLLTQIEIDGIVASSREEVEPVYAAPVASDVNPFIDLRLDRATALKLKALLASVA